VVWFSEVDLRVAAGPTSFARGRDLVSAVLRVQPTAEGVRAVVRDYNVFLGPASPGLFGECGCRFGVAGNFCEHCVAVGLALLGTPADDGVGAGLPRIATLQRRLDAVLWARGPVDHVGSLDYASAAGEFLNTVGGLIESGHAAEARPLARRAVERIAESLLLTEDTSNVVGAACQRALRLYARACAAAHPNAAKLAGWLFQLELASPGHVDLAEFAEPLGDAGLATYRGLVDDAWHNRAEGDIRRALTLLVIRERLAKLDEPVTRPEVEPSDLPSPAAFLGVAPGEHDSWLAEFLVQAYLDTGRGPDALELRRSQLTALPTREQYVRLRDTAVRLDRWPDLRAWALDVLRVSPDDLAGALLDDGDVAHAWQVAEKCTPTGWLEVARRWEADHPADVMPGYRALITEYAAGTGRPAYRRAVTHLGALHTAATRANRLGEFHDFLTLLRERHHRKTALLNELDRAGLIPPHGLSRSVRR
jgi:hypothetical protein